MPRQARLFAWADPTGPRKLTWTYAASRGEHALLKVLLDGELLGVLHCAEGSGQVSFLPMSSGSSLS